MRATRAWSLEAGVALVGTRLARDPDRGDGRGQLKAATRMLRAAQPRKTSPTGMSEKRPSPNLRDPHAHVLPGLYINRVPRGSSTRERMHSGMMDSVRARRARAAGACLALTTLTSRVSATQLRNAACRDDEQQQSDGVQGAAEATVRKYEADVRALPSRTSPLVGLDLPCPPVTAVSPVTAAHHTAFRAGTIQVSGLWSEAPRYPFRSQARLRKPGSTRYTPRTHAAWAHYKYRCRGSSSLRLEPPCLQRELIVTLVPIVVNHAVPCRRLAPGRDGPFVVSLASPTDPGEARVSTGHVARASKTED